MKRFNWKWIILFFIFALFLAILVMGKNAPSFIGFSFPEGTTIGGVDVGKKTMEEAERVLSASVEEWESDGHFVIETDLERVEIPKEAIVFHVKQSVKGMKERLKKPWYAVFQKEKAEQVPLSITVDWSRVDFSSVKESIDVEKTKDLAEKQIQRLGEHRIWGAKHSKAGPIEKIAETSWELPEGFHFIDDWLAALDKKQLTGGTSFSLLEMVKEEEIFFREAEGNFIASMLYSLLLRTDADILRSSQREVPPYSEPGIEAKVSKTERIDLIATIPSPASYTLSAERVGNRVTMSLFSVPSDKTYVYEVGNRTPVPYRTIVRYNKQLQTSHRQLLQEGRDGLKVEVYRRSLNSEGKEMAKELISKDFYLPKPEILLCAPGCSELEEDGSRFSNETDTTFGELPRDDLLQEGDLEEGSIYEQPIIEK